MKIMTDQKRPCDEDTRDDIEMVFTIYDRDGKGYVNREDIK